MRDGQASRTAERVAERRAAHQLLDRPLVLDDPIALRVIDPSSAQRLRDGDPSEATPLARAMRAFFAARSRFAEDELAAAVARGLPQYVLLGAGYDTFAYRNPHPSLRVFEIDHPATQERKRRRLADAGIPIPTELTFAAVDLAVTPLDTALRDAGFDLHAPAVIAWLGVVPYLDLDAIERTFRFVASLAAGSAIVFDYGRPREALSPLARTAFDAIAARVAKAGEPWVTFFEPDELAARLRSNGFDDIRDLGADEINARYFANRDDDLRVGGAGRIAIAAVR